MDGKTIVTFRNLYGLQQRELAELMGCSDALISLVESGNKKVTFNFVESFCKAINIASSRIFLYEEFLNQLSECEGLEPHEREIIALYYAFQLHGKDEKFKEKIKSNPIFKDLNKKNTEE